MVANLDYLQHSIAKQLQDVATVRKRILNVKSNFVDSSKLLRKKALERQNIERVVRHLTIIKSLAKLPQVIETISRTSLPYESLSLLRSTKNIVNEVKDLSCLSNVT